MQGRGIETTREGAAAGRLCQVIGSGESCDGIQQDDDVLAVLHEALRALDDHFRDALVVLGQFVKGGIDDFHVGACDGFLNICHFLRALVDQQNDQVALGIVELDRPCNFLQQGGFTGLGRRYDHTALALSDGAHEIHDAHGDAGPGLLQTDLFVREDGRHLLKRNAFGCFVGGQAVDGFHIQECAEFLTLGLDSNIAFDDIAGLQTEAADLAGCDVDVVIAWQIVGAADKSVAIRKNFKNAVGHLAAVQLTGRLLGRLLILLVLLILRLAGLFLGSALLILSCCALLRRCFLRRLSGLRCCCLGCRCRLRRLRRCLRLRVFRMFLFGGLGLFLAATCGALLLRRLVRFCLCRSRLSGLFYGLLGGLLSALGRFSCLFLRLFPLGSSFLYCGSFFCRSFFCRSFFIRSFCFRCFHFRCFRCRSRFSGFLDAVLFKHGVNERSFLKRGRAAHASCFCNSLQIRECKRLILFSRHKNPHIKCK